MEKNIIHFNEHGHLKSSTMLKNCLCSTVARFGGVGMLKTK